MAALGIHPTEVGPAPLAHLAQAQAQAQAEALAALQQAARAARRGIEADVRAVWDAACSSRMLAVDGAAVAGGSTRTGPMGNGA